MKKIWLLVLSLSFALAACQPAAPLAAPVVTALPSQTAPSPTATAFQPQLSTPTAVALPTFTPTVSPPTLAPNPLQKYTISAMRARIYGAGAIQMLGEISDEGEFIRHKFRYPSDGLTIYGYVNIPKGDGPFPVVIMLHGNYDTVNYKLMPYTTYYADRMAQNGYVVFHPNLRNFGESSDGDDRYRTGQAADTINLVTMLKLQGGKSGGLSMLNPNKIGLWAHSMGGEVALRALTITDQFDAAVLYAPMSGNLLKVANAIKSKAELNTPPEMISAISSDTSYSLITTPIKLYHGTSDEIVPVTWSYETCDALTTLGKNIDCLFYDGAKHTFNGNYEPGFEENYYTFFETYLQ